MKRWILVTSGKGGVGKSLVARLLAEMKREAEPATWLVDGASRTSIADALDLGEGYDAVAVRSEFWGNDGDYRRWLSSGLRSRLFAAGGVELVLPRLRGWIVVDLDEKHLPFAAGTRPGVLDYPDDEVLTRWLVQARTALSGAGPLLGVWGAALRA